MLEGWFGLLGRDGREELPIVRELFRVGDNGRMGKKTEVRRPE